MARATRLDLVAHASTVALRAAAFPGDEPVDAHGRRQLAAVGPAFGRPRGLTSPAAAARETAAALGATAAVEPMLRDCGYGRWAGRRFAEVMAAEPDAVALWLSDPEAAPHGGEPMSALLRRIADWLDGLAEGGRILAVTHAAVLRAAVLHVLGAGWPGFRQIDVAPLAMLSLSRTGGRWTLTALSPLQAAPPVGQPAASRSASPRS